MVADTLQKFIDVLLKETPDNCLNLYFSRWNELTCTSYLPQLSNELQHDIIDMICEPLLKQLNGNNIVEYNPIGVGDGEIEKLKISSIPHVATFLESIKNSTVIKDMSKLEKIVADIGFYCIKIAVSGQTLFLFRQFQKLKRLRKGILARIVHNELQKMENNFLGIDEITDIIMFGDEAYIIKHVALERIFKYRDEFAKRTHEALEELHAKNVIVNIEQFTKDCCKDIRIIKRFTNIMTKGRLPLFFDNYNKVPEIVQELRLDITFDSNGKLIYRERSQLFHIIRLLSDSYFKSLLADRKGVVKTEEEL